MGSFENFVTSNLGLRKALIVDTVDPSSSSKTAGPRGSQFLNLTDNSLYEKTGVNNSTDWVQIRKLGEGGGGFGDSFIDHSGEALANFIALNDDVLKIYDDLDFVKTELNRVVGGGAVSAGSLGDVSLYALSTDVTAVSGFTVASLSQFSTRIDDALGTISSVAKVNVSDTPPSSPTLGDFWWQSDAGRLKIYYSDADSSQWVDANPQSSFGSTSSSTTTSSLSLPYINFMFEQTTAPSSNIFGSDILGSAAGGWKILNSTNYPALSPSDPTLQGLFFSNDHFFGFEQGEEYSISVSITSDPSAGRAVAGVENYRILTSDGREVKGTIFYPGSNFTEKQIVLLDGVFTFSKTTVTDNWIKIYLDAEQDNTYYIPEATLKIIKIS
jgi:hypothetical protein